MKVATCVVVCLGFWVGAAWGDDAAPLTHGPYDADPRHPWNQLHEALFARTAPTGQRFGMARLDPLFWGNTQHLLTSPSREEALRVLDDFLRSHAERLVRDPLKRVLLQHDLWALFDWSASPWREGQAEYRAALQRRLATLIRRIALSTEEIARLRGNESHEPLLEGAGLQGLLRDDGTWVVVGRPGDVAAPEHVHGFGGRSIFFVLVQLPGGREPALGYLQSLREFVPARVYAREVAPDRAASPDPARSTTNAQTVQFPAGTQWALVRRMCLIDQQGNIRASPIVESIQARRYVTIPLPDEEFPALRASQVVTELQLDRTRPPRLRKIEPGDRDFEFVQFRSMGWDPFENVSLEKWKENAGPIRHETLATCAMCHLAPGILSVNTYSAFGTAANELEASTVEREVRATIEWKSRQFEWGRLTGLWLANQQGGARD